MLSHIHQRNLASYAQSTKTSLGETSGGVLLAPHVSIALLPFPAVPPNRPSTLSIAGKDWVAVIHRVTGADILCIQLYLGSNTGIAGYNAHRNRATTLLILDVGLDVVAFGDWDICLANLAVPSLRASQFHRFLLLMMDQPHAILDLRLTML